MHHGTVCVFQLILIDSRLRRCNVPGLGAQQAPLQNILAQLVDVKLRVLADGDHAEPIRRPRLREHGVEFHRVQAVVIIAALSIVGVILAGIQDAVAGELAVMQQCLPGQVLLLVVPVPHQTLPCPVHVRIVRVGVVIRRGCFQLALVLWEPRFQIRRLRHACDKQVPALLNVLDPRLPVNVQQVKIVDINVAQPIFLLRVPPDEIRAGTVLQLAPPGICIHFLKLRRLHDAGENGGQLLGLLLVSRLSRKHVRLRVVVHRVGVLVGDGVKQPCGGRLRHIRVELLPHGLPVPHPIPKLILFQAVFQQALAVLVLPHRLRRLADVIHLDCIPGGHLPCGLRLQLGHETAKPHAHCLIE